MISNFKVITRWFGSNRVWYWNVRCEYNNICFEAVYYTCSIHAVCGLKYLIKDVNGLLSAETNGLTLCTEIPLSALDYM